MSGSPLSVLALVDLDGTCFQSRSRCPDGCELTPMAVDRAGAPRSFATLRQRHLLELLLREAEVVPVTGRDSDALRRVHAPFRHHAITSFGGVILTPAGTPDREWEERTAAAVAEYGGALAELNARMTELARSRGRAVRARVVRDHGLPLYLSVKRGAEPAGAVRALARAAVEARMLPDGWRIHLNGGELALLPPFLAKEHAVRWLLERLAGRDTLTVGVGDSRSDAPFLAICDYAIVPRGTQLATILQEADAYAV